MKIKERISMAKKLMVKPPGKFLPIDLVSAKYVPDWMTRAYSNNRYVVMIDDNAKTSHGSAICARVQTVGDETIPSHWMEMQKIKNEIFGEETYAVEYYPAESRLMNDHNIYWMWIFPPGILPTPLI